MSACCRLGIGGVERLALDSGIADEVLVVMISRFGVRVPSVNSTRLLIDLALL